MPLNGHVFICPSFVTISDSSKPLMGTLQQEAGVTSLPANCPSQAIVDVSENMRAKLYALFCKIGESNGGRIRPKKEEV